MNKFFEWIENIIETAFHNYFQTEQPSDENNGELNIDISSFLQTVKQYTGRDSIDYPESVILGLALAPHFSPQILDLFFVQNEVFHRPYTEFGGKTGGRHKGFIPTAETAMFLLTAGNVEKRIEMMKYFNPRHWLYVSGLITLRLEYPDEPLLSGILNVSNDFLNYIYAFTVEPDNKIVKHTAAVSFLDKKTARDSPCMQCASAPCCKLLHLESFTISTLPDFDKIGFYLNFENIEAILSSDGQCTVYYAMPCRFFNESDATCTIHNQKEQPSICIHYSPYKCFYKKAESDKTHIEFGSIWLNDKRLEQIQRMTLFNSDRAIVQTPSFQELVNVMNTIPYVKEKSTENSESETSEEPVLEPCAKCTALCCTHLLFPSNIPSNKGNLDYYKYTLGFPGIEYIITDNAWALLVHTRCRHLNKENRCSIYNREERPLHCRYFDPYKCHVKQVLNTPHKVNANYDNFPLIAEKIHFDELDNFTGMEPVESLKIVLKEVSNL